MSKKHYKLYKSGKQWLTMGITIASLAFGITMATDAQADVVTQNNAASTTQVAQSQQVVESETIAASYASTNINATSASANIPSAQPASTSSSATNIAGQTSSSTSVAQNGLVKENGNTYYYNNNAKVTNEWEQVNNNWYYFGNEGNAQTGWYQSQAGFWYYFNDETAQAETGWQKINNAWYYFDNVNAFAWTNWHLINGSWYFFDLANAWADTGYHIINGIEYYFDPVNANLYQNRWVNVNGWTYHADNSGRLWFPQWHTQFPVGEGCSVASLWMLLSPKEYINLSYGYNLLQARQSGNIYTCAGFSLVIQPNSLVELAHHFDSSVRNISGSSVQDIINIINSGHPVEYYGYSRYENTYWARNHCKVIVGYQNGWFRVFDPCYNYASQGSSGWNAYDYGAKGWITTAQFAREYAGQAITVD